MQTGIILVDHGSRVAESNAMIARVVEMFKEQSDFDIVEPAHMELAEPSIATAFQRCIDQGAEQIVVHPYFLFPGRHVRDDIPRLAAEAAERSGVDYVVTQPLGLHDAIVDVICKRVDDAL